MGTMLQRSLPWWNSPSPSPPPFFSSPTLLLSLTLRALLSALHPLKHTIPQFPKNMVYISEQSEVTSPQILDFVQLNHPPDYPSSLSPKIPLSSPPGKINPDHKSLSAFASSLEPYRSVLTIESYGIKSDSILLKRRCRFLSPTSDSSFSSQIYFYFCIYFLVQPSPVEGTIKTGVIPDEYIPHLCSHQYIMASSSIPPSDSEMEYDADVIDDLHDPLLLETLNLTIAGKLISNQRPSEQQLQFFVSRARNCPNRVEAYELGRGIYSFSLLNETDIQHALDEGPWYIAGGLLVVATVTPETPIDQMPFSHSYMWVRIHDLPPPFGFIDKSYPIAVGNALGYLKDMELLDLSGNAARSTFNRLPSIRRYLRIRVYINILEPLKKDHLVIARAINGARREITLRLSYEHLPDVCFRCGVIGHLYNNCSVEGNGLALPYGEWIRSERFGRIHGQANGGPHHPGGAGGGREHRAPPAQAHIPPVVPMAVSNYIAPRASPPAQINADPLRSFSPSSSLAIGHPSNSRVSQSSSPTSIPPSPSQLRPSHAIASSSQPKALLPPKPRAPSKPWPSALIPAPVPLTQAVSRQEISRPGAAPASGLARGPITSLLYGAVAPKPSRPDLQAPGILGGRPVGVLQSGSAMSVAFGTYQSFLKGKELAGVNEPWASPQARSPVSPLLGKNILKDLEIVHPDHSPFPPSANASAMVIDTSPPDHSAASSMDLNQAKRKLPPVDDAEIAKKGRQDSSSRSAKEKGKSSRSPGLDKLAVVVCDGDSDSGTTLSLNR